MINKAAAGKIFTLITTARPARAFFCPLGYLPRLIQVTHPR